MNLGNTDMQFSQRENKVVQEQYSTWSQSWKQPKKSAELIQWASNNCYNWDFLKKKKFLLQAIIIIISLEPRLQSQDKSAILLF